MSEIELKQVMGGLSAAMVNALSRAAATLLTIGRLVGSALRKATKR